MILIHMKYYRLLVIFGLINIVFLNKAGAQQFDLQQFVFQNQFGNNAGMAGSTDEINLNIGYKNQWNGLDGAPVSKFLSFDAPFTDHVGLGIKFNALTTGLIKQNELKLAYAYHIKLGEDKQQLNFGISYGYISGEIEPTDVIGNQNDPLILTYNQNGIYWDGDLGISYVGKRCIIQGVLPNLRANFSLGGNQERKYSDWLKWATFYSVKLLNEENETGCQVTPVLGFKRYNVLANEWTYGILFSFMNEQLNFQSVFSSSQNLSLGTFIQIQKSLVLMASYSLETGPIHDYANGAFEFGLGIKIK